MANYFLTMLLISIVIVIWLCISFAGALMLGRFIVSCDKSPIPEGVRHTSSLKSSKTRINELVSDECDDQAVSELLSPFSL
jgi:hypothetical protein